MDQLRARDERRRLERRAPGAAVHRPGPLQARQRLARPPGRRHAAADRGRAHHRLPARDRPRGAFRRRRVHGAAAGRRRARAAAHRRRRGGAQAARGDRGAADRRGPADLGDAVDRRGAVYPGDGAQRRRADASTPTTAMYRAKARGRAHCRFFDPGMAETAYAALVLEGQLAQALRARRVRAALPAAGSARARHAGRRRGAGALEPPGARPADARRVHPAGRAPAPDAAASASGCCSEAARCASTLARRWAWPSRRWR